MKSLFLKGPFSRFGPCALAFPIFLFSVSTFEAFGQNRELDSLKSLVEQGHSPRYCDALYLASIEFMRRGQFDSARIFVHRLRIAGQVDEDTLQIVRAMAINASITRRLGQLDSAKSMYSAALRIARKKSYFEQTKNILNSMGILYTLEARYDQALKCHFESLEIRQHAGNEFEVSVALYNIGLVYYKLDNFDKALLYYTRALRLKKQIKDIEDLAQLYLNIAWCFTGKMAYDVAREYIDTAFLACGRKCPDILLMDAFLMRGKIAFSQRNYFLAEKYFSNSYSLAQKSSNVRYLFDNTTMLSKLYMVCDKISMAEGYLSKAQKLVAKDVLYRSELAEVYQQFISLYDKVNDLNKKAYFQEKYIAIKDNIFNEKMTVNLMKAESEFVERESNLRIESQNEIMLLNKEIMFRQRITNVLLGIIALLATGLTLILAWRVRAKQISNRLLDQKVKERTFELEIRQDTTERTLQHKDLLIHKASSEMQSSLATIKGLCFLGEKEVDFEKSQDYWTKLNSITDRMRLILERLVDSRHLGIQGDRPIPTQILKKA